MPCLSNQRLGLEFSTCLYQMTLKSHVTFARMPPYDCLQPHLSIVGAKYAKLLQKLAQIYQFDL
jgi:hypothetical protein